MKHRVPVQGNKASKPVTEKTVGVEVGGETPSLTGEFLGETHRVLEYTQAHPPGNQHQKGSIYLWAAGEVTENLLRDEQAASFPLGPLPHIQHHNTSRGIAPPWCIPKALPLTTEQACRDKKNMAQMKEQIKAPEEIQPSNEQIANL